MKIEMIKKEVFEKVDEIFPDIQKLNKWMYENPELPTNEYNAVEKLTKYLEENSFKVEYKVAGLDTAFIAKYVIGKGGPKIGFLAEYDALPEVGHGCGHNVIGASCVGAAVALSKTLKTPCELIVYGTPDEEYDGGKIIMAEKGVFKDLEVGMQVHVSAAENYVGGSSTPHQTMVIGFKGKSAHTASNPHEGVNSLHAILVTFTGLNALHQYLKPGTRIPATVTHGGGAPNAVPHYAEMRVHVTTKEPDYLHEVVKKVENCAKAGGLATGAEVDIWKGPIYKKLYSNSILEKLMEKNMRDTGRKMDSAPEAKAATDVGNISWECPTTYAHISLEIPGTAMHTRKLAATTVDKKGQKALKDAINTMAGTTIEIVEKPELLQSMKEEFNKTFSKEGKKV